MRHIQQTLRWSGLKLKLSFVPSYWNPASGISKVFEWGEGVRTVVEARATSLALQTLQQAPCTAIPPCNRQNSTVIDASVSSQPCKALPMQLSQRSLQYTGVHFLRSHTCNCCPYATLVSCTVRMAVCCCSPCGALWVYALPQASAQAQQNKILISGTIGACWSGKRGAAACGFRSRPVRRRLKSADFPLENKRYPWLAVHSENQPATPRPSVSLSLSLSLSLSRMVRVHIVQGESGQRSGRSEAPLMQLLTTGCPVSAG